MINFYLVRHGQTDVNLMNQIQGQLDTHSLNDTGQKEVERLAKCLKTKGMTVDAIVSSPLKRAKETAAAISKVFSIDVSYDDRFKEINCGECEGVEISAVRAAVYKPPLVFNDALTGAAIHVATGAELRDYYASNDARYDLIAHPRGETKRAAAERAFEGLRDIARGAKEGSHIWVACHSTLIKLVLAKIVPNEATKKIECAEVVRLSYDKESFRFEGRIQATK